MPAMPSMNMAAMKTVVKSTDKGAGMYEGQGDLGSGGIWQITITARQNGQIIATKKLTITAKSWNVTVIDAEVMAPRVRCFAMLREPPGLL
jgi:hypothetical protein